MLSPDESTIAELTASVATLSSQLTASQSSFAAQEVEFAAATQNWSSEKAAFTEAIAAAAATKAAGELFCFCPFSIVCVCSVFACETSV